MNERRATASEVIKALEAKLSQASELIDDVDRLLAQASEIEASARDYALRSLGPVHGAAAYDLALVSYPSLAAKRGLLGASLRKSEELTLPPSRDEGFAPSLAVVPPQNEVSTLLGVEFPSARLDEAQSIIAEAAAHRRTGGTTNLYASNRGKNAWRRSLFKAALDSGDESPMATVDSTDSSEVAPVGQQPVARELPEPPPPPPPPPSPAPSWDEDPLDDPVIVPSVPSPQASSSVRETVPETSEDPVNEVPEPPEEEPPASPTRPTLGLRRPSYGNSNPKPEGLAEAIQAMRDNGKDPTVPPPSARPRFNKPGFLRKGRTT